MSLFAQYKIYKANIIFFNATRKNFFTRIHDKYLYIFNGMHHLTLRIASLS